jgi:hypothetical protein
MQETACISAWAYSKSESRWRKPYAIGSGSSCGMHWDAFAHVIFAGACTHMHIYTLSVRVSVLFFRSTDSVGLVRFTLSRYVHVRVKNMRA